MVLIRADYQIQLNKRRVRGLPLWFSLATHGTDRDIRNLLKEELNWLSYCWKNDRKTNLHVELVREPSLSCVLYRRIGMETCKIIHIGLTKIMRKGFALVTPTKWKNGDTYRNSFYDSVLLIQILPKMILK